MPEIVRPMLEGMGTRPNADLSHNAKNGASWSVGHVRMALPRLQARVLHIPCIMPLCQKARV